MSMKKKLVSIQEAVRKMTSLPAQRLGLTNRGRLTPGYAADIVIMDLPNVKENATFLNPHQYPTGITHVIVNGEIVIKIDPRYYRPTEVQELLGDASKAKRILNWEPKINLEQLVSEMVDSEIKEII